MFGLFSRSRSSEPAVAPLRRGRSYRVRAHVARSYADSLYRADPATGRSPQRVAEDQISAAFAAAGFEAALATQDPSTPEVWTLLGRWTRASKTLTAPAYTRVVHIEEVEPLFEAAPLVDHPHLDAGLTEDDLFVIGRALETEVDPKRLEGIARGYDGDFPVVAAALRCKSRLETLARYKNRTAAPMRSSGFIPSPAPQANRLRTVLRSIASACGAPHGFDMYDATLAAARHEWPDRSAESAQRAGVASAVFGSVVPSDELAADYGLAVSTLSREPKMCTTKPEVLARILKLPQRPCALALASTHPMEWEMVLVDAEASRTVMPRGPKPVANGALQLAHAMMRPEMSLVDAPRRLSKDLDELSAAAKRGDPMAIKARAEVQRARRLLDRQSWVGWYRRHEALEAR